MIANSSLRPPLHILGAGSIGQLWAISIRSKFPEYPITLLLRGSRRDDGSDSSRSFRLKKSAFTIPAEVVVPVQYVDDDIQDPIQTLLVTTKSYQASDAVQSVMHRLADTAMPSRVVLLCNGALSVQDELLPIMKDGVSLILAMTTHGAYREEIPSDKTIPSSCLVHAGVGKAFIQEGHDDLAHLWEQAGLNCSTLSTIAVEELLWKKLAANCVINPLTALFQCTNGELLLEPSFPELQQELISEVARVAQASFRDDTLDEDSLRRFVVQVIDDTKENKSSMLQDVLHQKRTEIDHLNGYIVRKGRSLGIECPANEDLVSRIKELPAPECELVACTLVDGTRTTTVVPSIFHVGPSSVPGLIPIGCTSFIVVNPFVLFASRCALHCQSTSNTTTSPVKTSTPGEEPAAVVDSPTLEIHKSTGSRSGVVGTPLLSVSTGDFRDKSASDDDDDDEDSAPGLLVEPDPISPQNISSSYDYQPEDAEGNNNIDQELIDALLSFGFESGEKGDTGTIEYEEQFDKENEVEETLTETLSSSPLPDIELDFGDDNFLIDPDQLENIFDEGFAPQGDEDIGGPIHLVEDPEANALLVDQDTEDLYRELANLSLKPAMEENSAAMETTTSGEDDQLPPFLYCQPCIPASEFFDPLPPALEAIGEDEPLSNMEVNRQPHLLAAAQDFQALLEQDPNAANLLRLDENDQLLQHMEAFPELRPEAREAAGPFIEAFGLVDQAPNDEASEAPEVESKQRSCYTHRETIFGVTFSECGQFCATASQDSTICIWHVPTNAMLAQFQEHSKAYECLRVAWASTDWASHILNRKPGGDFAHLVASSGADGVVKLWACPDPLERKNEWRCVYTLDHSALAGRSNNMETDKATKNETKEEDDAEVAEAKREDNKPQTYALQFIDHWQAFTTGQGDTEAKNSFLMTSSDEFIHFWDIEISKPEEIDEIVDNNKIRMAPDKVTLKEVMSLHFDSLEAHGFGVSVCSVTGSGLSLPSARETDQDMANGEAAGFGGDRNPENKVFVFDAAYCIANGLLGAALSDGSLRLINGRGICISLLNLPGCQSHLTSFCWDSTGTKLATSVATGHLITWKLDAGDVQGKGRTVATCTAIMEGGHQLARPLFGSRYCGKDENLIVSWSVDGSLCLWDAYSSGNVHAPIAVLKSDPDYPIYTVELSKDTVAIGGGSDGGFIGVPLYLYTFGGEDNRTARSPNPKRPSKALPAGENMEGDASLSTPDKKSKTDHSMAD